MVRGWYIGASGMNAQQSRLDAISNNLANVDTTGYKRDVAVNKAFSELLLRRMGDDGVYQLPSGTGDRAPIIGKIGLGVETNEFYTIFEQGSFKATASNVDAALDGEGFIAVQTPAGERYTRNGAFKLGKEGILETKDGYPVLGENGLIRLSDDRITVTQDGGIYSQETGGLIDRFRTVRFDNERYLKKEGTSFWRETPHSGPPHVAEEGERPRFLQGYVETSNVNVVNEMVQMIEVNRAYEANQKTIQAEDSMMTTLWTRVTNLR
ncbi:MAG: flagellar basal-body rod protein FlgF [Spirochaetaceae bacterium]|jgi:flagellar basal-body rod protein FlgG|nr:flagellar basal-body rod protein FlgF [Spirochaetaceae bacterium]